jgi:succinyl-CoA synthetase beta subunit
MNLHEYQAKAVFRQYGLPVPNSKVATTAAEAEEAAESLSTPKVVVKAQVHAGGVKRVGLSYLIIPLRLANLQALYSVPT